MTTESKKQWQRVATLSLAGFLWGTVPERPASPPSQSPMHRRVLVQGTNLAKAAMAVRAVGGEVTHELGIINSVGARLTPTQIRRLEASDDTLRIQADRITSVSARKSKSRSSKSKSRSSKSKSGSSKSKSRSKKSRKSKGSSKREQESRRQVEAPQDPVWDAASLRSQSIAREWEKAANKAVRKGIIYKS